jgi:hypothetical protein
MVAVAGLSLLLFSAGAAAQEPARRAPTVSERMATPKPQSEEAEPRWHSRTKAPAKQPAKPIDLATRGEAIALMVAGGAVFVAGVITGGDAGTLLMVGGAVVGGYGIYLHFR